jgi:hypothetical protein
MTAVPNQCPAILVTNEHLLGVEIETRGQRLLDVLNDTNTSFLCVNAVRVFRRGCTTPVATLPQAVIQKSNVALAIPAGDTHEAPQKRSRSFVPKRRSAAFLVVLGYEVRGELALKRTDDPVAALCHELGRFFPVPNGTVAFAGTRCPQQTAQVVIVNSDHVSLLQLGEPATETAGNSPSGNSSAFAGDPSNLVVQPVSFGTEHVQPK